VLRPIGAWIYARRLLKVTEELGLQAPSITVLAKERFTASPFDPVRLADVAESLAARKIDFKTDEVRIVDYA
jgi:hypothetical protein